MILPCTCPVILRVELYDISAAEFQHKLYKGKRVHTPLKDGGSRCTVCGKEKKGNG